MRALIIGVFLLAAAFGGVAPLAHAQVVVPPVGYGVAPYGYLPSPYGLVAGAPAVGPLVGYGLGPAYQYASAPLGPYGTIPAYGYYSSPYGLYGMVPPYGSTGLPSSSVCTDPQSGQQLTIPTAHVFDAIARTCVLSGPGQ